MGKGIAKDMSAIATAFGHVSAYVDSMVLKCAVQLKLANIVHAHAHQYKEDGHAGITISQLAKSLPFNSVNDRNLYRVMRYLVHMGLFTKSTNDEGLETFGPTRFSEFLRSDSKKSVLPLIMFSLAEPVMSAWNCLSTALDEHRPPAKGLVSGGVANPSPQKGTPFEVKHGYTFWEMLAHQLDVNENFNGSMARNTGLVMPAVAMMCKGVFERLGSFVDVGGGTGLATVFSHIKCSVLDLPHILTATIDCPNVEPIPGDMFVSIPHADAVFLKVLDVFAQIIRS